MIAVSHAVRSGYSSPVALVEFGERSSAELSRLVSTAIAAGEVSLVVDLGTRDDLSSDLLSLLHRTGRHLRSVGGYLAVVSPRPELRRLLDLTLQSRAFDVFASRDEALAGWR